MGVVSCAEQDGHVLFPQGFDLQIARPPIHEMQQLTKTFQYGPMESKVGGESNLGTQWFVTTSMRHDLNQ